MLFLINKINMIIVFVSLVTGCGFFPPKTASSSLNDVDQTYFSCSAKWGCVEANGSVSAWNNVTSTAYKPSQAACLNNLKSQLSNSLCDGGTYRLDEASAKFTQQNQGYDSLLVQGVYACDAKGSPGSNPTTVKVISFKKVSDKGFSFSWMRGEYEDEDKDDDFLEEVKPNLFSFYDRGIKLRLVDATQDVPSTRFELGNFPGCLTTNCYAPAKQADGYRWWSCNLKTAQAVSPPVGWFCQTRCDTTLIMDQGEYRVNYSESPLGTGYFVPTQDKSYVIMSGWDRDNESTARNKARQQCQDLARNDHISRTEVTLTDMPCRKATPFGN